MKLLIATGVYPPEIGGPGTYTVFLEKHLGDEGHTYTTVPYRVVARFPKIVKHGVYVFSLIRASQGCDIIYALDTVSVGFPAMIASMITRKPLFLRVPGDYAWEQGQQRFGVHETLDEYRTQPTRSFFVRVLAWIQFCVARYATQIVVPSEYMKGVVVAWGVNPEKVTRVYSALKVVEVRESKEALRTRIGHSDFVILTAARLVPWKGVHALITALSELRKRGVSGSLDIVGDGTDRAALELHARTLGVDGHVRFRGVCTREVLGEFVMASDAFVLNTSYEGFSHQLLEVMHAGVPVITTPVGGNVELITHNVEGLLVPFNDVAALVQSLSMLMTDASLVQRLTERAKQKVEHFHEDVVIKDFFALIS